MTTATVTTPNVAETVPNDELFTADEMARALRISVKTLKNQVRIGTIPTVCLAGRRLFFPPDVIAAVNRMSATGQAAMRRLPGRPKKLATM